MKSPTLLSMFIASCVGSKIQPDFSLVTIDLQKNGRDKGFTDLEIKQQSLFHIIIEAKKNWTLPGKQQLTKYTSRFKADKKHYPSDSQVLVTMSGASNEYAERNQPKRLKNYPIKHFSWLSVLQLIDEATTGARKNEEKLWLRELRSHLKRYNRMTSPTNNLAYCVVLSNENIRPENDYTFLDVIQKDNSYFHPLGESGWPVDAPNYLAFRYKGNLLSVHHIDSYQVTNKLTKLNKYWPLNKSSRDYLVYTLGPAMKPENPPKNGSLWATQRIWCALDTLLSGAFETIAEARNETKRRIEST